MNFFKTYKCALFLTALFSIIAVSCSGKDNPADTGGGNIVCKDSEAWIMDGTDGGYIFRENGDMIAVEAMADGSWYGSKAGTYSTAGNKLTVVVSGETDTMTYSVSGGKLTLSGSGDTMVFTKRTGVYVDL